MQEKWITYAVQIREQIFSMFDEDTENYIDKQEFADPENFKQFLYALSTVVPTEIFNTISADEDKSFLEFNHVANHLCFEYCKIADEG